MASSSRYAAQAYPTGTSQLGLQHLTAFNEMDNATQEYYRRLAADNYALGEQNQWYGENHLLPGRHHVTTGDADVGTPLMPASGDATPTFLVQGTAPGGIIVPPPPLLQPTGNANPNLPVQGTIPAAMTMQSQMQAGSTVRHPPVVDAPRPNYPVSYPFATPASSAPGLPRSAAFPLERSRSHPSLGPNTHVRIPLARTVVGESKSDIYIAFWRFVQKTRDPLWATTELSNSWGRETADLTTSYDLLFQRLQLGYPYLEAIKGLDILVHCFIHHAIREQVIGLVRVWEDPDPARKHVFHGLSRQGLETMRDTDVLLQLFNLKDNIDAMGTSLFWKTIYRQEAPFELWFPGFARNVIKDLLRATIGKYKRYWNAEYLKREQCSALLALVFTMTGMYLDDTLQHNNVDIPVLPWHVHYGIPELEIKFNLIQQRTREGSININYLWSLGSYLSLPGGERHWSATMIEEIRKDWASIVKDKLGTQG